MRIIKLDSACSTSSIRDATNQLLEAVRSLEQKQLYDTPEDSRITAWRHIVNTIDDINNGDPTWINSDTMNGMQAAECYIRELHDGYTKWKAVELAIRNIT